MPRRVSALRSKLEYRSVTLPVDLMRRLSFPTAFRLGERLGAVAFVAARPLRRIALVNLRIAFPEKSDAERLEIVRESCRNYGRMAAEFCHMHRLTKDNVSDWVTFADPDFFFGPAQQIIGSTGILLLTGHFGNWELLAHSAGLYGTPVHFVHRPFRNPLFHEFVMRERMRAGTGLISKRSAARDVMRVLRNRGIVGIPYDQNATGRWGVFVDFFGVPASTHPGLARLAELSGAPVYPVFLVRQGGTWKHQIEILPPVETVKTADRDADTLENCRRFNRVFEDMVRRHPDHWIWMHKRWKTRPPGEAPVY